MNITVFLGAPGSGKGTQAKRLADSQGFQHFSTGDMLRAAIQQEKPVGAKAKAFMDKGALVPDEIMIELIEEALSHVPATAKVLLDGFPRTVAQAHALDANEKTRVARVIYFKVEDQALIARLTGRRVCKKCGASFHVQFMPPKKDGICDTCGSPLIQRPDDSADVVQHRLEVFKKQNGDLLSYYTGLGKDKVTPLNADIDANVLQKELVQLLK